ncbi:MAG: hypothetical protein MSC31_11145 [Solirubrobacteraceae bacterium MAG38_C4-C5]|nr:hypothetical protein [Candidatus Siliceabacter maunaloa]
MTWRWTRGALAGALAMVVVGAGAASASASTIEVSVSADPTEDRAFTVTATGTIDEDEGVYVSVKPAGGAGCDPVANRDITVISANPRPGGYSLQEPLTLDENGSYLLCGYVDNRFDSSDVRASTTVPLTVRPANATIGFANPPRVQPEQTFALRVAGATEVGREVFVTSKPAGGAPCGAAYDLTDDDSDIIFGRDVNGAYDITEAISFSETGSYLLCAWVQEFRGDLKPEAAATSQIDVGTPSLGGPMTAIPPFAAKLEVDRARVLRSDRRLDVLAPITARASGDVQVAFRAAGRTESFGAEIDSANRRVRFNRGIPRSQANLGTGILTLTYPGDADTQPQEVRLRAASQQARLDANRPRIEDGRLKASGDITSRARGVVRLQLLYEPPGQPTVTLEFNTPISDGRYSFDEELSPDQLSGLAGRRGVVHSYTLFTGYFERRIRGEMQSFQVVGQP